MSKTVKYIFAERRSHAQQFAHRLGLRPTDWRFIGDVETFYHTTRGIRGALLLIYPTASRLSCYAEILYNARAHEFVIYNLTEIR